MADTDSIGRLLLLIGLVGTAAVLSNRITAATRIPAAVLLLAAAAAGVKLVPSLRAPSTTLVHPLVTVALVFILFNGGMDIGWSRFRRAARPIVVVGVLGTVLTTGGAALLLHFAIGLGWYPALLVATAVAPTDPAVVFSVLGGRGLRGRSSIILAGESGANDPVGIALMASLLAAGGISGSAVARVGAEFVLQLSVGAVAGVLGGIALRWFVRRVRLPDSGLYPLRTLAAALAIFGLATLAHGSGFLAVLIAGVLVGEAAMPFRHEVAHFHAALAGLGEMVAFVALGLTVDVDILRRTDVWVPGLALGVALAVLIRPLLIAPLLARTGLARNEKAFVLFAGLKGAVPILLGSYLLSATVAHSARLYGIVVVVVLFSVLVQGSLVPTLARRLGLATSGDAGDAGNAGAATA